MLDTTKLKVEDLRKLLVTEYGVTFEEVNELVGKGAVVAKLRECEADDALLDGAVEVVEDVEGRPIDENEQYPRTEHNMSPQNPGWTEWVIGFMFADELFEGHPKVDGLRRMADFLKGPIREVISEVVQTPDLNNNFHATVKVSVLTDEERVDGCADAGPNNTDKGFSKHPVAVAESRAEGRAYRKLLRLRNIISAEEVVKEEQILDEFEAINSAQVKSIDRMCSDSNINVEKWLKTHNIDLADFSRTPKSKGTEICSQLNTLRGTGEIPAEILGYDFNWRN
jgi:hypothetical protein